MEFAENSGNSDQPYKYNGKELDKIHGLNMYDYSARYYEPAIGRFTTVDPLAEKYYSISPYAYCNNNPIKFVDPTGMWYDDYFNMTGKYLGTDNDPNSSKVRVMDDKTWETNKTGEGTIGHENGVANSELHSKSGISKKASMEIYKHYNVEGRKLINEAGDYMMQNRVKSFGNEILDNYIALNVADLAANDVADDSNNILNLFVHENKHGSDYKELGVGAMNRLTLEAREFRAISAQVNHPTFQKTTEIHKFVIKKYANDLKIIVPGLNYHFLKTPITAPMRIK